MKFPGVTVVIPCYNSAAWIGETLESVRRQDGVDVELVVIDDGSTDNTGEVVMRKAPEAIYRRTENRGVGAARALGATFCTQPFLQYLDSDDLLAEGKLRSQIEVLESTGADVAYGDWIEFKCDSAGRRINETIISRTLSNEPDVALFTWFWCPPAAYLLRADRALQIEWRCDLPVIQDARFMVDLAMAGASFVKCDGIQAHYRKHTAGSVSSRSREAFLRDCLLNAQQVQAAWGSRGVLSAVRRKAVAEVYHHVFISSQSIAPSLAKEAWVSLKPLRNELPAIVSGRLRWLSRLIGYRAAVNATGAIRSMSQAVLRGAETIGR